MDKILSEDWTVCDKIQIGDVWIVQDDGLEFFVFDILKEGYGDFVYFSSFDFKKICSGILIHHDGSNYFRVCSAGDEQDISNRLLREFYRPEDSK